MDPIGPFTDSELKASTFPIRSSISREMLNEIYQLDSMS